MGGVPAGVGRVPLASLLIRVDAHTLKSRVCSLGSVRTGPNKNGIQFFLRIQSNQRHVTIEILVKGSIFAGRQCDRGLAVPAVYNNIAIVHLGIVEHCLTCLNNDATLLQVGNLAKIDVMRAI